MVNETHDRSAGADFGSLWGAAPVFAIIVTLLCGSFSASAQTPIDPNTMKVEGVVNNLRLTKLVPEFSWVYPGPGTQTNWQIEVDDDPNFTMPLWFWESGTSDKGSLDGLTHANYGTPRVPTGNFSGDLLPVDSRPNLIYWRLRVQRDNDSSWTSAPFARGVFKMNQLPITPGNVTAAADGSPGTVPGSSYPASVTPKQFYVSTSGNDSNSGTIGSPFRTVNKGVRALHAGDILNLRGGTYRENVDIRPSSGASSGDPTNPIVVRSYPGETAWIEGPAAGTQPFAAVRFTGSPSRISNWIIENVGFKGGSLQVGVYINNAEYITLRGIFFDSSFNPAATGVRLVGGGQGNRILDSLFDKEMFDHIDVAGSRGVEIRHNLFTNFNRHTSIEIHSSGGEASIVSDNVFRNGAPSSCVVAFYLSSGGAVARNNIVHDVPNSGGLGCAFQVLRSGKILIENNTVARVHTGVFWGQQTKFTTVRSNIFYDTDIAFDFEQARKSPVYQFSAVEGTSIVDNIVYDTGMGLNLAYPEDANVLVVSGNCPAVLDQNPSVDPSCDPKFANAAADDFRLTASSPAIDATDPALALPVPSGGGSLRDAGAAEFGASGLPPYDYQPSASLDDSTPRFTWSLTDPDNLLNALNPSDYPGVDTQGGFEVQIDPLQTFDSVSGNRPMFSSGIIESATQGYTLPDANALAPGDYYVRIRQHDNNQVTMGTFSNNAYRLRVSAEPQPPVFQQLDPAPGALGVDPNATISAHVLDFGDGVDKTTIEMRIGVNDPSTPTVVSPQVSQVGPTPQEFVVSLPPGQVTFGSGDVIYVLISADDLYSPPNSSSTPAWSFTIADTVPPANPAGFTVVP